MKSLARFVLAASFAVGCNVATAGNFSPGEMMKLERALNQIITGNPDAIRQLVDRAYYFPATIDSKENVVIVLEAPERGGKSTLAHYFAKLAYPQKTHHLLRGSIPHAYGALPAWLRDPDGGLRGGVVIIDEPGFYPAEISRVLARMIDERKLRVPRDTPGALRDEKFDSYVKAEGLTFIFTKRPGEEIFPGLINNGGEIIILQPRCIDELTQLRPSEG